MIKKVMIHWMLRESPLQSRLLDVSGQIGVIAELFVAVIQHESCCMTEVIFFRCFVRLRVCCMQNSL